jgi:hypothetical protein
MPQKPRTIHPGDAQDERLAGLPLAAAFTYAYLPTILDDEGRAKDQPAVINGYLWPLRADEHGTAAMIRDIDSLVEVGLLCRYTVGGRDYLHDPRWKGRQKIARPIPSTLPGCPSHDKTFDEVVTETVTRVSEQVNAFLGTATSSIDEAKIRDSIARVVEDVTFLIDPEKAASYGQKVRDFFAKTTRPHDEPPALDSTLAPAPESALDPTRDPNRDTGGNGRSTWSDTTDRPPSP